MPTCDSCAVFYSRVYYDKNDNKNKCSNCKQPMCDICLYSYELVYPDDDDDNKNKCVNCMWPNSCDKCNAGDSLISFDDGSCQKILCSRCLQDEINDGDYKIIKQ